MTVLWPRSEWALPCKQCLQYMHAHTLIREALAAWLTYKSGYPGLHEVWGHPGEEELESRAAEARELAGRRLAAKHVAQLHNIRQEYI